MTNLSDVKMLGSEVADELWQASHMCAPMHSPHEGYAVLLEEVEELWDEIKKKNPSHVKMRAEALQVAAMGARFIHDIIDKEKK